MGELRNVFISYGRRESKAFAKRLYERLCPGGYQVWFDQNDIPLAVDFQDEIDQGIAQADNFIYIIAPHSVNSPYCAKEIELALRLQKRIIPILHIEGFGQEVWQERYPEGSQDDWIAFQATGRHSSFQEMHPEIGKRNWVYMREQCLPGTDTYPPIDDFDQAFEGLVAVLDKHKDYVRQHTQLLQQTLDWERQQKQSALLLVGQERQAAEAWILRDFSPEQPPVLPTDLHALYISEARKNAENRMTDVFLTCSMEDRRIRDRLILALARHCITTWTPDRDIAPGQTMQEAIREGIEKADNLLFFIDPHTLQNPQCIDELNYARSLNKRIIPIKIAQPNQEIPQSIRYLNCIDFTDNTEEIHFDDDFHQLLQQLQHEKSYHERHKMLLVQAIKWQNQSQNPSILLRGHNLQRAQAWLKLGIQRKTYPPNPLHQQFIEESAAQTGNLQNIDIFISYSRTDSDFARQLNERLQASGKTTWFDQENIEEGVADFGQEIRKGIEQSDNFLFIISPDAIASPYCQDETEYARSLGKRILTIRWRPLHEQQQLPPALATIQWITLQNGFDAMFNLLIRALEVDRAYVMAHNRWQRKALEWSGGNITLTPETPTNDSLLLRGEELNNAEAWLKESTQKQPPPTTLQQQLIQESLQESQRDHKRRQRLLDLSIFTFAVIIAGGVLAVVQWVTALQSGSRLAAYDLIFKAETILSDDPEHALQLAKTAYEVEEKKHPRILKAFFEMSQTYLQITQEVNQTLVNHLPHQHPVLNVYLDNSYEQSRLLTRDASGGLHLWSHTGNYIRTLVTPRPRPFFSLAGKSTIEQLNILYSHHVKGEGLAAVYEDQYVIAYQPGKQQITLWDGNGLLIFEKKVAQGVLRVGFASSLDQELQVFWIVSNSQDPDADTQIFFADRSGQVIYEEKAYESVQTDTLFSTASYERNSTEGLKASFRADGKSIDLTYPWEDKEEVPEERFEMLGLPDFWGNRMLLLGQDGLLIWTPYYYFADRLKDIAPLDASEKVAYDIASLEESFQVPAEAAYQLAKLSLFLLFFYLSVIALTLLYRLFLGREYLRIVVYAISALVIVVCWSQFLVYRDFFASLPFAYGLFLSGGMGYYLYRSADIDAFKRLFGWIAMVMLVAVSLLGLYFTYPEYSSPSAQTVRRQVLSLILFLGLAKVSIFAVAFYGLQRFYNKKYNHLADWCTSWLFVLSVFLTAAYFYGPSNVQEKDTILAVFFLALMPLLYVFRLNAHQFVLARLDGRRSSRRLLRFSTWGFVGVLVLLTGGLFVDGLVFLSLFWFGLYLLILYVASFVIAIVQKDRFSLWGNIGSSIGIFVLVMLWGTEALDRNQLIRVFPWLLLGVAGLGLGIWQYNKYRRNILAQRAVVEA